MVDSVNIINNVEESDNDESPDSCSFKTGNEELKNLEKIQRDEISNTKQRLKKSRALMHERNRLQKEAKRQRLEALEQKKLPLDFLNCVKEDKQDNVQPNFQSKKVKKIQNKRESDKTKSHKMIEVQTLTEESKKFNVLSDRAASFKSQFLHRKNVNRVPSKDLRMKMKKQN